MSENGAVKLERNSGVATLTFTHPKANSLPAGLLDELIDATRVAATDSAVELTPVFDGLLVPPLLHLPTDGAVVCR